MKKYIQYLNYVIRHKYFVARECFKQGLYWRGIIHDSSKLLPNEFFPYTENFYGKHAFKREKSGYYDPTKANPDFQKAWLHHQNRNDHHWQYWCLPDEDGTNKVFPMSEKSRLEMVCDWCGASQAQGKPREDVLNWYEANKDRMIIHEETRQWIEEFIRKL